MYLGLARPDIFVLDDEFSVRSLSRGCEWPSVCEWLLLALCVMPDNVPTSGGCGSNERLVCERLKESSKRLGKLIQELDLSRGLLLHCSRDMIESRAKVNLKSEKTC